MNNTERLLAIFVECFPLETDVSSLTRASCAAWDSLQQLNIVLAVEQEFNVSLSDADAIDLSSVELAKAVLSEYGIVFQDD